MEKPNDTEQRLVGLEIKASYAEDLLEQLSQSLFRQQRQIDLLMREVTELRQQAPETGSPGFRSLRDELPPHF